MANPSKRTPWVVEFQAMGGLGWFPLGAYRTKDEADAHVWRLHKRVFDRPLRVRNVNEEAKVP
jgi:hypothetical protein